MVEQLIKRFEDLRRERANWESHWQECYKYCIPQKLSDIQAQAQGQKIDPTVYDSTPILCAQIFAAGLHGYLTNPAQKWFALGLQNPNLEKSYEVQDWLKECEDIIFDVLNNSNFNQQIDEAYLDFGVLGTTCVYEEEDPQTFVRFYTRPIKEIFVIENSRGVIDTVFRFFTFTALQAYEKFGKSVGEKILGYIDAKKYDEEIEFLHIVIPREIIDITKKDASNKPYASYWINYSEKKIVFEGGYDTFPFFIPRYYKTSDNVYGYSPAMMCLPDIKTVNSIVKTILKASQKMVDPPIILPNDGYMLPFKTTPGAINFKVQGLQEKLEVLQLGGNIPVGLEVLNDRRQNIKSAFFTDLFLTLMQLDKNMTAREVIERVNERMLILGPILGRLMSELLSPLIHRTFDILAKNFVLPPPPEILRNQSYIIRYISPLARAQKVSEIKSITEMLTIYRELATVNPIVLDMIDFEKTTREIADIYNLPHFLVSEEEFKFIQEQRQKQQELLQQAQLAKEGIEAISKLNK